MLGMPRRRRHPPPPVNCEAVQEAISARLDNETSGLDEPTVTRHLSECPPCRAFQQAWQTPASQLAHINRELRLGPAIAPPFELAELAARESRSQPRPPRRPSPPHPPVLPALSTAGRYLIAATPAAVAVICLHAGLAHPPHKTHTTPVSHCTHRPTDLWVSPEITVSK
jgi:anti-sigma factor RsiW